MTWIMEVRIKTARFDPATGSPIWEWHGVRPTNGSIYQYETRNEAARMLAMCYPESGPDTVRIREVTP